MVAEARQNVRSCSVETLSCKKRETMAKAKKGCVDDLATLSELNEEIILQELQARYQKDIIYVRKWNDMLDEDLLAFRMMLYG